MGCDGGTIPRRDEMVKLKKKAEKADRDVELVARWRHCALSGEELQQPVVACELGRLYNKEAVLMALLDKSNMPEVARHIRSLKDVVELKLTPNPSYSPDDKASAASNGPEAQFVCPVSGLEMSGRHRFVYLRGCGCVFAEKATKEVPSENCHKCGRVFNEKDIVVINGSDDEVKRLTESMIEKRAQARLAKRKRKAESSAEDPSPPTNGTSSEAPPEEKRKKLAPSSDRPGPSSASASKLNVRSAASAVAKKAVGAVNSYKSVADDPSARSAYKSLFNSGAKERPKDQTAHWVTFFPYH